MDEHERLEEWTMQMAAGADPLTALAALPDEPKPRESSRKWAWQVGLIIGVAIAIAWLVWGF